MGGRRIARVARGGVVLCGLLGAGFALGQGAESDTVYRVHGTVVDGVSGKPVMRALVRSGDGRLATLTDGEGRFGFDIHVPVPKSVEGAGLSGGGPETGLMLIVVKPGCLVRQVPTVLALDAALSATEVKLKCMPAAVVEGTVSAGGTDAAPQVTVMLWRRQVTDDGRMTWVQAGSDRTTSRGAFRFPNLQPGEYTVSTMPWRGEEALQDQFVQKMEQYPAAFYGDGRTLAGATKLRVRYGETAQMEIHLQAMTFYPVTIPLVEQSGAGVNIRVGAVDYGYQVSYNSRKQRAEALLPDGHYDVAIFSVGDQPLAAQVTVDVAGAAVRSKPVVLLPAGKIRVRVHPQYTQPDPAAANSAQANVDRVEGRPGGTVGPPVQMQLRSAEAGGENFGGDMETNERGDLWLRNVGPGSYFVQMNANRGYVAALTAGGVDLLENPLVVSATGTAPTIDVTLRDDVATVTGSVTSGGGATGPSSVVFVPTDASARSTQCVAGADGKFTMDGLVPGRYRVLAFPGQHVAQIAYRDAEAMHAYDGLGVTISVTSGQTLQVEVPLLDEALAGEDYGVDITL